MEIHHGQTIERIIRRNGFSCAELARRTGVNRRTVLIWFERQQIKPEIICLISEAINHNFAADFPDLDLSKGPVAEIVTPVSCFEVKKYLENDHMSWELKYVALLERYNLQLQNCSDQVKIEEKLIT